MHQATEPDGGGTEHCVCVMRQVAEGTAGHERKGWADIDCDSTINDKYDLSLVCERENGMYIYT